MGKINKQIISCFKCSRLGVDCAAMRIPSKECFKPIKSPKKKRRTK